MKMYKIRNKKTGKFSSGTSNVKWQKDGKSWAKFSYVAAHVKMLVDYYGHEKTMATIYQDAEIVEYDVVENKSFIGDTPWTFW